MKHSSMKKTKRKSPVPMGLKGKLVLSFLSFAALLLCFLWVFQIVLLDDFYSLIKEEQLHRCTNAIVESENGKELHTLARQFKEKNNMAVAVYNTTEDIFYQSYGYKGGGNYSMDFMPHEVYGYYRYAKENGGRVTCSPQEMVEEALSDEFSFSGMEIERDESDDLVCAVIFEKDGGEYMALVKSHIAPVTSTIETLRIQLIAISVLFIVFAIVMAILVSGSISRPLTKTNKAAKELARQNYQVTFEGKGYREIYELSDTLNYASRELSTVDALRRELIANISHDLRTPLTMIGGYAEVMRDIPGENTGENLQVIIDETEHLSSLVSDLLDLSRLEAGNIPLETEEFNLTEMVRGIFERYSKFTEKDDFHLNFEYTEDVYVKGDELRLSQVVYNLINNAINYSPKEKNVTVRQTVNDGKVRIEVVDKGRGIEPEKLKTIWDRYYRGDEEHKQAVVGTGLGLSIVKNILSSHNARFGVTSRVGEGSNFWFELEVTK